MRRLVGLTLLLGACPKGGALPDPEARPRPPEGDDLIYFVLVDRFANGDHRNDRGTDPADPQAWHGGDLRGVTDHLDHLSALGVRTVWLSPISASRQAPVGPWGAYHGYWVQDLRAVEPRFGDEADLRRLREGLHARGMRLVLDMVYNHTDYDAPLRAAHPDWYHPAIDIERWDDPVERVVRQVHGLPDLAQEQEAVYSYLRDASFHWIDAGLADGFRIDAVRHMPASFLSRLNRDLDEHVGGFTSLGEDFTGDALTLSESQAAGGFDQIFDFPLRYAMVDVFCKDQPPGRLAAAIAADRLYPDPSSLVTFLDNHDMPRITTECGEDPARVKQALFFQMTTRGTPALTYGTEALLPGGAEPDNRRDMPWSAEPPPLYRLIRSLQSLRSTWPSLREGRSWVFHLDTQGMAYARLTEGEAAVIFVNRSDRPWRLELPAALSAGARKVGSFALASGDPILDAEEGPAPTSLTLLPGTQVGTILRPAPGDPAPWAALLHEVHEPVALTIEATGIHLSGGNELLLVGSGPEVGNWDPNHGLPLRPGRDGNWTAPLRLPPGAVAEFKLVARLSSGETRWQEGPNTTLLVSDPEVVLVPWVGP